MKFFKDNFKGFMLLLLTTMSLQYGVSQKLTNATIAPEKIAERVATLYESNGGEFNFADLTDEELYSMAEAGNSLLEIVYKPQRYTEDIITSPIAPSRSSELSTSRSEVLRLVGGTLQARDRNARIEDVIDFEHEEAPIVWINFNDLQLIKNLRSSDYVQEVNLIGLNPIRTGPGGDGGQRSPGFNIYIQALINFGFATASEIDKLVNNKQGCSGPTLADPVFITVEDGGYSVPWHYEALNIPQANTCKAGAGVKIAMLDTGVDADQVRLSKNGFKKTYNNRNIHELTTYDSQTDDKCGHGTLMAGVIAGPQYDSAVRGVAYQADFVSIRSNADVLLTSSKEYKSVAEAIKTIRKSKDGTSGTKVVSMSLGFILPSAALRWEFYWVNHSIKWSGFKSKIVKDGPLLIAAAGTSDTNKNWVVVYPAKFSWVTAVTGVFEGYPVTKTRCNRCHYGKEVDFVVPMQKYAKGDNSVLTHSLMDEGADISSVGGSSVATATMAGVAALVYSKYPSYSRLDVFRKLRSASTSPNSRDKRYGHGVVDAARAINCSGDPCAGVQCPDGQRCINGNCVRDETPGDECLEDRNCPPGMICLNGYCTLKEGGN